MKANAPVVYVLTDGGGRRHADRTLASRALMAEAGATCGPVFGRLTDHAFYQAVLQRDERLFIGLLEEVADDIAARGLTTVVGDAAEGYNPAHDLCRAMADFVTELVSLRLRRPIANYAVSLAEWDERLAAKDRSCIRMSLSDSEHAAKIEACRGYPGLNADVEAAIAAKGEGYFRDELVTLAPAGGFPLPPAPLYERIGEERVRDGCYSQVIRYADHVAPLVRAMQAHVRRS